jgi:GNAT superfamily N-acetyltransferase
MSPAALRDAMPGDAPAPARLRRVARAAVRPGLREVHSEAEVAHWLATTFMARHAVRVAAEADRPTGHGGHGLDPRHQPMVLHLYLEPGWWRRGLGSRLLGEALAAHGGRLSLFCVARNGARRFYENHGFRVAGTSDGAGTEEGEPDILHVRDAALPHDQHRTGENA